MGWGGMKSFSWSDCVMGGLTVDFGERGRGHAPIAMVFGLCERVVQ